MNPRFCERLKELRNERGISQVQLAQSISVSKNAIGLWENGLRDPSLTMLIKLAQFFDVSLDYLSGLKDW